LEGVAFFCPVLLNLGFATLGAMLGVDAIEYALSVCCVLYFTV
jgi:hypothetical protein